MAAKEANQTLRHCSVKSRHDEQLYEAVSLRNLRDVFIEKRCHL